MNRKLITLLLCLISITIIAQTPIRCFTNSLNRNPHWINSHKAQLERYRSKEPEIFNHWSGSQPLTGSGCKFARYIVPVVVHILYDATDSVNTDITDAQVNNAIERLNKSFYNEFGGVSPATNTYIQFCLASIDPNGTPFSGIEHISSELTRHDVLSQADSVFMLGNIYNPDAYFNIYVVKNISVGGNNNGPYGYSTLPGAHGLNQGVVIKREWFGDSLSCSGCSLNIGARGFALSHEAGHYFGLLHPFEGSCSGSDSSNCATHGDLCCDVPQQFSSDTTCGYKNTCTETPVDKPDMQCNYMSYANEYCQNTFTADQLTIMYSVLNGSRARLVSPQNINNTNPPCCYKSPHFTVSNDVVCDSESLNLEAYRYDDMTYRWRIWHNGILEEVHFDTLSTYTYMFNQEGDWDVELTIIDTANNDSTSLYRTKYIRVDTCGKALVSEQANWLFGTYAGLTFKEHGVVKNVNAYMNRFPNNINAGEGCLTQSDSVGRLLFYFGGDVSDYAFSKIYNKEYLPLQNGDSIIMNWSNNQGCVALKRPNNNGQYFLVIANGHDGADYSGLRYSIVDMSLDGGKGGIVTDKKNIPIYAPRTDSVMISPVDSAFKVSEMIGSIPKCNGEYWLIVAESDFELDIPTNTFILNPDFLKIHLYNVTKDSFIHVFKTKERVSKAECQVNISPDGSWIIADNLLYRFNRASGKMTFMRKLSPNIYHAEFSPNSKLLYLSIPSDSLFQVDLYNPDSTSSIIFIGNFTSLDHTQINQIQSGPNGKIYINNSSGYQLNVLNNPDSLSSITKPNNCDLSNMGPILQSNGVGGACVYGLPNMVDAKIEADYQLQIHYTQTGCNIINFEPNKLCYSSYKWVIDTIHSDTSRYLNYTFTTSGKHYIQLIADLTDTALMEVNIGIEHPVIAGNTHFFCDTTNLTNYSIANFNQYLKYTWEVTNGNGFSHPNGSIDVIWDSIYGYLKLKAVSPKTGCKDSSTIYISLSSPIITDSIYKNTLALRNCPQTIYNLLPSVNPQNYTYKWMRSTDTGSIKTYTAITGQQNKDITFDSITMPSWVYRITSDGCKTDTGNILSLNRGDSSLIYFSSYDCVSQDYFINGNTIAGISHYYYENSTDGINWNYMSGTAEYSYIDLGANPYLYIRRYATNNGCNSYSNILKIQSGVSITQYPRDTTACLPNSGALFTIGANYGSGNNILRYQWQVKDSGTTTWNNISGATQSYLNGNVYSNLSNKDSVRCKVGIYCAAISTIHYLDTSAAAVLYKLVPTITTQPSAQTISEGGNASFAVSVGNKTNCIYKWEVKLYNKWQEIPGATDTVLNITSATRCNEGYYRLKIYNGCVTIYSNSVKLTITNYNHADLWSHDSPKDNGAEPDTASENDTLHWKFWRSIDLWNRVSKDSITPHKWWNYSKYINNNLHQSPDYSNSGLNPNYLYVRIYNKGTDTSKTGKLYTYWTVASTGERWPRDWKQALADSVKDINNTWRGVGSEINKTPITIPAIAPGKDTVMEIPWFPPNPRWYTVQSGGNTTSKKHAICLLARIETCDSIPYGMSYAETDTLRYNVKYNNNIVTRNTEVVDDSATNTPIWVYVRNVTEKNIYTHLNLISDQDDYFDYGNVKIYMDDSLKGWWTDGGSLVSGLVVGGTGSMVLDTSHSLWLKNIMIPPGKTGQIGLKYVKKNSDLTAPTTFDFHLVQYESKYAGDTTGDSSPDSTILTCGDCGMEVGDEDEDDTTYVYSGSSVTMVDNNGNPMHLVGGVHHQVTLNPLHFSYKDTLCMGAKFYPGKKCVGNYKWYFGDGTTDTIKNPVHVFPYLGTYQVSLVAGLDSTSMTIIIGHEDINLSGDTLYCDTSSSHIFTAYYNSHWSYHWSVDGTDLSYINNAAVVPLHADSAILKLQIENTYTTCKDSISQKIKLATYTITDSIALSNIPIRRCPQNIIGILPNVNPENYTYIWMKSTDVGSIKTYTTITGENNSEITFDSISQPTWIYRITTDGCKTDTGNIIELNPGESNEITNSGYACDNQSYTISGNSISGITEYFYEKSTDLTYWSALSGTSPTHVVPMESYPVLYVRRYIYYNGCTSYSNILELDNISTQIITTAQPRDTSICLPNTGNIFDIGITDINGGHTITYQWQVNSSGTWTDISGVTTSVLNGTSYSFADNDLVRCRIGVYCPMNSSNQFLYYSNSAEISSQDLSYTQQPSSQTLNEGDNLMLNATASNAVSYQWKKYNMAFSTWDNISGETSSSLNIYNMQFCDDGSMYKVFASDACGNSLGSDSALITMNSLVSITAQPRDTSVCLSNTGDIFTIGVTDVYGGNTITYQWQVNNSGTWTDIYGATTSILNGAAYSFTNGNQVRCKIGTYCSSTSTYKDIITSDVAVLTELVINYTLQPSDQYEYEGNNMIISATIVNAESLQWQIYNTSTSQWEDLSNENSESLILTRVKLCNDGKQYRMIAYDACGNSNTSDIATIHVSANGSNLWSHNSPVDIGNEPDAESEGDAKYWKYWHSVDVINRLTQETDTPYIWWNGDDYLNDRLHQSPVFAQPNYLYVRIYNKGTDTAKTGELYTFWSMASTNEVWSLGSKQVLIDSVQNSYGDWKQLSGIINQTPAFIPALAPGQDTVIEIMWYPPNPDEYPILKSGSMDDNGKHTISILARIETCDQSPYGMTYTETESLRDNVKQNNNIVFRSSQHINGETENSPIWTYIKNTSTENIYTHVNLLCEDSDYMQNGTINIYMDDSLYQWWVNGGALMGGLISGDSGMMLDSNHSLWFHNMMIPAGMRGQIGIAYHRNGAELTASKTYQFHLIQYQSETSGDTTGGIVSDTLTLDCGGCGIAIGNDTSEYIYTNTAVKLVDFSGLTKTLQGGTHHKVTLTPITLMAFREKTATSTNDKYLSSNCKIIPNPARDKAELRLVSSVGNIADIYITDAAGKVIYIKNGVSVVEGLNQYAINTTDYAAGVYYVSVLLHNNTSFKMKMVVMK